MAQEEYVAFKKTCKNGYAQYYGITLDPVTGLEVPHQMTGEDWINAGHAQGYESLSLGCPPKYTSPLGILNGAAVVQAVGKIPPRPLRNWRTVKETAKLIGKKVGASKAEIDQIQEAAPYVPFLLMDIRNLSGHVPNPNDLIGVLTEYRRVHPDMKSIPAATVSAANPANQGSPRWAAAVAAIVSAAAQAAGQIAQGVSQGNQMSFVSAFIQAYDQYMTTDFAAIKQTLNATANSRGPWGGWGVRGALDMLLQYKNTSWKDLYNTISQWCAQNGQQMIPGPVQAWIDKQKQFEQELRAQFVANPTGDLNNNTSYGQELGSGAGNGGSSNNATNPSWQNNGGGMFGNQNGGGSFDFKKWLPWIIGIVVLLVVILLIVNMNKRKRVKQ